MAQGIDSAAVTAWLLGNVSDVAAPFTFELITGGRSNLTFAVTDAAGRRLVLRRPPMSHVLSTAHDMGREFRIISALRGTPVPVPAALGFCADEAVNERPFYVMDFVDGYILRDAAQTQSAFDEQTRRAAGLDLVDVLAAIHQVDIDAVGLGSLARREGYIDRQLRRWHGQFEQSQQQAREAGVYRPVPLVEEVFQLLAGRVPAQHGAAIVHGDYRIDNTVLSPHGQVRAVLDWELCTLGDPLADVGTLMAYWAESLPVASPVHGTGTVPPAAAPPAAAPPAAVPPAAVPPPAAAAELVLAPQEAATALPGFPGRAELARRYADRSGRDLAELSFYTGFAYWKLACILEGVYVRYAARAMGGGNNDADVLRPLVHERAQRALQSLQS